MDLDPLSGSPPRNVICTCDHDGNEHSHVLVDHPCLRCDCYAFTFDRYDDSPQSVLMETLRQARVMAWGQAVGAGLVDSRHIHPPQEW